MTDERYTFFEDVKEKKRTARGAHNKVTRGGRIKMPYDYLSRKEKEKLNGECVTYSLTDKLTWKQFKEMPLDIQVEYIDRLRNNGASCKDVYTYLGVPQRTFANWQAKNGIHFKAGCKNAENIAKWELFLERNKTATPTEPSMEVKKEEPKAEELKTEKPKLDLAELIKALAGTGAKLTIEITL